MSFLPPDPDEIVSLIKVLADPTVAKKVLDDVVAKTKALKEATDAQSATTAEALRAEQSAKALADDTAKQKFAIEETLAMKADKLSKLESSLAKKDAEVSAREKALDAQTKATQTDFKETEKSLADREGRVASREVQVSDREDAVTKAEAEVSELKFSYDTKISALKSALG